MFNFQTPKYFQDRGVANRLQQRSLLIAVNLVAGLSIFFFGYDQGVMAGVNITRDYVKIMGLGHWNEAEGLVKITEPLKQGGIVSQATFRLQGRG
jgi:hypothetical protein